MTSWLFLIAGGVLLYLGGESVVRGGIAIGLRVGLPPVVVGLTIVAFGTSAPELAVSVDAALSGHGDVALANVVGSNLANVALVLALCAIVTPVRVQPQLITRDIPLAILAMGALAWLLGDGAVVRLEAAGFALALVIWLVFSVVRGLSDQRAATDIEPQDGNEMSLPRSIGLLAVGLVMLAFGGDFFVSGGVGIARSFGVSEALIGLTILAVGTSLPELVTSFVAAFRGSADLAVGNIVGSNVFNVLAVVGIAGMLQPLPVGGLHIADLLAALAVTALLWPVARTNLLVERIEGVVLLTLYIGFMGWRIFAT